MNVPLAQVPQAPQGAQLSNQSMDLGQDVARATQKLGGAVSDVGATIDAYNDKRYEQKYKVARDQLELSTIEAEAKVEEFAMNNPSAPEKVLEFKNNTYATIWDSVKEKDLRPEHLTELQENNELIGKKGEVKWKLRAEKMSISNGNSSTLALAESYRRSDMPQEAYEKIWEMVAPNEYKEEMTRKIFSEGVSADLSEDIRSAYAAGDTDKLNALLESVTAKDDAGLYTEYETIVEKDGKDVRIGGISSGARKIAREEISAKLRQLEVSGIREMKKMSKEYSKTGEVNVDPRAPKYLREVAAEIATSDFGKLGMGSSDFVGVNKKITEELENYSDGSNYLGMKAGERKKLWNEIKNGDFTGAAKMKLFERMLNVEQLRAGQTEELGEGFKGIFRDPNLTVPQQELNETMVSWYAQNLPIIRSGLSPAAGGELTSAFLDTMDEVEAATAKMSDAQIERYTKETLPNLIKSKLEPIKVKSIRNIMRGEVQQNVTEEEYNSLAVGATYYFNGKTYTKK